MNEIFDNLNQAIETLDQSLSRMEVYVEKTKTAPYRVIHGRTFDTKEDYDQALHDFLNENWSRWFYASWHH